MKLTVPPEHTMTLSPVVIAIARLYPHRKQEIDEVMLGALDRGLELEIKPRKKGHTDNQRGYYHLWKNQFADFCGNTPDEMHEYLLMETYGSELVNTKIGEVKRPMHRSSSADVMEYSRLIDTLIRVAADMGFYVPPPDRRET